MKRIEISTNVLSTGLFVLAAVIIALFGGQIRRADLRVQEQMQIEENRRSCEQESQILADASDYLTSQAWHFVATGDREYLDHYWLEVNELKTRDRAIDNLEASFLTQEESGLVERAKQESDNLIAGEAWAMRLVADSIKLPPEQLPPEVARVTYRNGEEKLSPAAKRDLASQYIFGEEYSQVKESIKGNISSFRRLLRDRKNRELGVAVAGTHDALQVAEYLMWALIAAFVLEAGLYYFLMHRPFHFYSLSMKDMSGKNFTPLLPRGGGETRAFARAFNQIYSEWERQKESLEQERYRFHMALENTSIEIYEYDVVRDVYTAYGELVARASMDIGDRSGEERVIPDFIRKYAPMIADEDALERLRKMAGGDLSSPAELEIILEDEKGPEKLWIRITGTPVYDENHVLTKIIGKIANIQSEKEKEFAYEASRSRDALTGLFKKDVGIRKVREFMEKKSPDEICGMMLLDMDDFGRINEEEGSVFADAMLQEVADILCSVSGPEDILIRLGGDEFMLFLRGCPKSRATVLGPEIARRIQALTIHQDEGPKISASIGMCVTEVVDEYSGLYRCAESTLNYVKEHGKGQAACYLDTSNELGTMLTQMYPGRHLINSIDRKEGAKEDLASFALDLLGKAKNLDDAIFLLLARVGKTCLFDRISISEIDMGYLSCNLVYQWARIPSDRQSRNVRYLTKDEMNRISSSYDEEGLCHRYVLDEDYGMSSVLHAAIWNYGCYAGAMSFELHEAHVWSAEERRLLSELTKIISSFTLKAQADAVSKAKTDFLSRMSHEIRTPMNAITGMTAIAKTVLDKPQKAMDCLNKIESANKYLLELINDVLDMSRIESGKVEIHLEETDLRKLSEDLETMMQPQAEAKKQQFVVENHLTDNRWVVADELRLNQVLVNLLGNAVKFTGEGGRILLDIQVLEEQEQEMTVRFLVEDNGIGISEEAQKRIFNAFEQAGSDTASNYGGTGLGLAISSRLVQLMGGSLEVDSAPGRGSVFHFTLKMRRAKGDDGKIRPPAAGTGREASKFDPHGKRLLLAEDNELNQEIAQELLAMHGFVVDTASNGREAVEQFEGHETGYYDAVLMDIRMPVMDGMEAARQIRTLGRPDSRTVPIIAMTANAFSEDMKKSLENGMDGHLSKPIDVEKLLRTLQELISLRVDRA